MLDAICTIDEKKHKILSIFEFKLLSDTEIDRLRYSLLCPVCKQKAYFRKASKDGKQACFGSRYHKLDCEEFTLTTRKLEEEKQVAEVESLLLEADTLEIDFSLPVTIKNEHPPSTPSTLKNGVTVNKQRLKKLLVSLLRGSSLAQSECWVYTSNKHKWRAKNLFVNVNEAMPTNNGAPRLYWGTFSHADKTINWLNPAEERTVAIPISKYREQLLARFNIQEARDLEGAGFIIFAKCVVSKDKKRKFLQLWNSDYQYFYISKVEE